MTPKAFPCSHHVLKVIIIIFVNYLCFQKSYFVTKSCVCSLLTTIGNFDIGGDITDDDNNLLVHGPAVSNTLSYDTLVVLGDSD